MDQIYEDKLDGKISEALWDRKQAEYREQELALEALLANLSSPVKEDNALTVERVFELANRGTFSVPYAECSGTRWSAQIGSFELHHGWSNS